MYIQVRIQDLCKGGGGKQDFADITQRSLRSGKNLDLKIGGGVGGWAPQGSPLDPHLIYTVFTYSNLYTGLTSGVLTTRRLVQQPGRVIMLNVKVSDPWGHDLNNFRKLIGSQ